MKRMQKKKGLSILLSMLIVITSMWSTGMVAHAMDTVIVAPENMLNVQVVDEDGNEVDSLYLQMKNENGLDVASWRANYVYSGYSGNVALNDSGISVGKYFHESWSSIEQYVPGKLVDIRYGEYQVFTDVVPFHTPDEVDTGKDLKLEYLPVRETALTIPANTLVINADEKWVNGLFKLGITYEGTEYIVNDMAGTMTSISMPANSTITLAEKIGGVTLSSTKSVVLGEESEYVKVRMKVSDINNRFNEDGTLNDDGVAIPIASGTRNPGEVYLTIVSGGIISYPVPDVDGYVEFFVEKQSGQYDYSFSMGGNCGYGGGSSGIKYASEKKMVNFRPIKFPETGTTLYNVSAGKYKISLSSVPSEYKNPGEIEVTVEESQNMQYLKIVLEKVHTHNFGTEYQKDATNHWKECACGEKSGVEAHVPGPEATEEHAQTCTVCGYEIAPKLDHDFGTEYKKDATNHWKECACGEKSGVEAHVPGPEATEDSAQTCTVCGYEIAPKLDHDFGTEYKKDATNHWKECACGEKSGVEAHVPGPAATEEHAQTCTVCGYEIAPKLDHDFGTEYQKDSTNHWKECVCGEKSGVEAHVPGPAATEEHAQTCTVCGYEIAPAITPEVKHTHYYNGYKYNDNEHWGECSCGVWSAMVPHEFEWIIDKNATQQEAGSKHQECTYCHYSRPAVEIAKQGFTSPKTDDNTYQWILLLAGISGMAGMGTLIYRRKVRK